MATKKEENNVVVNEWEEMRTVTLPRAPKNEQNFEFVGVNGRTFQVPKDGKPHEVPLPVYIVLKHAEEMRDYASDRADEMTE